MQPNKAGKIFQAISTPKLTGAAIHELTPTDTYSHTGFGTPISIRGNGAKSPDSPAGSNIEIITSRKATLSERWRHDPNDSNTVEQQSRVNEELAKLGYLSVAGTEQSLPTSLDSTAPALASAGAKSVYMDGEVQTTLYYQDHNPQA